MKTKAGPRAHADRSSRRKACCLAAAVTAVLAPPGFGDTAVAWPPLLPGGKTSVVVEGGRLLEAPAHLREGVKIAATPPRVRLFYYDCQTYAGKPWSVWGDGLVANGKYYSSLGDHLSPEGNAYVYEFDPGRAELKKLLDVRSLLDRKDGWYTPGKIHSSLGMGRDGWLYFSTHRGSTRVALDPKNHFSGDWIIRVHPGSGKAEVVAAQPLEMQCLPTGILDRDRMIWYAGSADGLNEKEPQFMAYDLRKGTRLYAGGNGPYRAMILAESTGMIYFHGGPARTGGNRAAEAQLYRFDPSQPGAPEPIGTAVGLRAASRETPDGIVFTIAGDELWAFDVNTETAQSLGPSAVGRQDYTTNLDVDPTGRFLYYVPGAHGGAEKDGTPVVQYDTRHRTRKVICFLHPALQRAAGYIPIGSFGSALSADGSTLYVTWNGAHQVDKEAKRVPFLSVAMTAIEIPHSERRTQ